MSEKNWQTTFDSFSKKNPKYKIDGLFLNANSWVDFFSNLQTRLAGGAKVDAVYLPTEGMELFSSRGIISPLDSYVKNDQEYVNQLYADVDPTMLGTFKQHSNPNGTTYYLPYAYNTTVLLYSKKIFHDRGVPEPSATWTWDNFLQISKKLNNAKRHYAMLLNIDVWGGFEPWMTTNGARIMNNAWTASAINTSATVEAFAFCRSLVANGLSPAPSATANGLQLMANGQIAIINTPAIARTTLEQYNLNMDDFQIVPYPRKKQQGASVGIGSIAMLKASKVKDAVWELIKWVTSPEEQNAGGGGTIVDGQLPIRNSASTSKAVLSQMPKGSEYFWKMLPYSQFVPGTANSTAMEGEMDTTWSQMLTGSISPSAAAAQMSQSITKNL